MTNTSSPIQTVLRRLMPLLALLAIVAPTLGGEVRPLDRWYVMQMSGQRAGWMHVTREIEDGKVTTISKTELRIKRGQLEMKMAMDTTFVETTEGKPISMTRSTDFGGAPSTVEYTFHDNYIEQAQGDRRSRLDVPTGKWLPPGAAAEFTEMRLKTGAEEITLRTMDPSSGTEPITMIRKQIKPAEVETMDGKVEGLSCVSTASNYPQFETTEYLDKQGEMLRSTVDLGMIKIDVIASSEETALESGEAPEMMTSLFITPSKQIQDPRRTTKASYVLSVPDGELPDIPAAANQRVERIDASSARVSVDTTIPALPFAEKIGRGVFLNATNVLQSDDPEVVKLTNDALAGMENAPDADRAEKLRRTVHRHISSKDLTVGFANAAEVARSGEGDCTEHAVLLAAMLRAAKIPSRVASGVIYADSFAGSKHIFGYHMWSQALLTGADGLPQWVDLDATLPSWIPFDATHIALSTSALTDDNAVGGLVELAPLMGRLQIKVENAQ